MNSTNATTNSNIQDADTESGNALISHLPGIIALNLQPPTSCELRAWGRTMALFKEERQDMYIVDSFHNDSNKKKHLKFMRKNTRYLKDIFNGQNDLLEQVSGDYKICIPISDRAYKIVSTEVRSEVYVPIAVFHRKKLQVGAYAYIWRCCSTEQAEKTPPRSISSAPVTAIVTGMCMFGTNIMGIDQKGCRHPLTNTFYTFPSGACIQSIEVTRAGLHPYEQMMLREFDLQLPMLKALGNGMSQKIFYQCVHAEYILYGINAYIRGEMTLRALHVYTRCVTERADFIRDAIEKSCERHGFEFDGGQSTLSHLFINSSMENDSDTGNWCRNFLVQQDIIPSHIESSMPLEERLGIIRKIFSKCIDQLASQTGINGEVWRNIREQILNESSDGAHHVDASSLLTLNFLNYAAKVAVVKGSHPSQNLCLLHPFQEKAMALAYKDLHADKFGEILAINWVPPIFCHGSFKDGLYYLEEHKEVINQMIHEGLLEFCAIETGAQAVGDVITAQLARSHIFDVLMELGWEMPVVAPLMTTALAAQEQAQQSSLYAERSH
jgi:hypothetical protein